MLERLHCCLRRNRQVLVRGISTLLAAGALCYSALAPALGLGDLTLRSYLNQPFKADIELTDTAGLEPDEVAVTLASVDDYARAGIDRLFFLNDLRFAPDFSGSRKVIHVTSSRAVTEPYLTFLVEVSRPGGQLLRAFTVLLDPPGTVTLPSAPVSPSVPKVASADARPAKAAATSASRPPATQGKHYVVVPGDTLWTIGKRLEAAGTPTPTNQLVRDIHALNPASAPLKAGQSLLLPDAAVLPGAPAPVTDAAAPTADAAAVASAVQSEAALNAQLKKNLEDLQGQINNLQGEVSDKDKQVDQLQTQLGEGKPAAATVPAAPNAAVAAPATAPAGTAAMASAVAPSPTPAPAAAPPAAATAAKPPTPVVLTPVNDDDNSWMLMLGMVALLLLLVALLLVVRRNRQRNQAPIVLETELEERPAASMASGDSPVPVPGPRSLPQQQPVSAAARRDSAPATDALDGASIYIAYGRYNEALGILREGLYKQPERIDLRLRMLEVLGQMADREGFDQEEDAALAAGISAERLHEVRAQFPKLAVPAAPAPAPSAAEVASLAAAAVVVPVVITAPPLSAAPEPDFDLELVGEPIRKPAPPADAGPALVPLSSSEPEFDLDLDDLSMSSDWQMVSPFETPSEPLVMPDAPLDMDMDIDINMDMGPVVDTDLTSNLKEYPELLDVPEEQFLSDFADLDEPLLEHEPHDPFGKNQNDIDNEFLDSFISDADLPELDALTVDFDLGDTAEVSAEKLKQARDWIDRGDFERASEMLHQLLIEGDESTKFVARQLLSSID